MKMKQMNRALMVAMIAGSCSMVSASAWALDPAPCASDADCGEGIACESGYCAVEQPKPSSECEVDADCAAGYSCQVVGASGCAVPAPNEPAEPCVSEELRACVPPPPAQCDPSKQSADCSGGDVCVTYTFETCSGGDAPACICADGTDCECGPEPEPEPGSCQSEAVSYCVPPYLAPCSVDLDCGAGFTCEQQEICTASCSGGSPSEPGAPDDQPSECESSCAPSGQSYCQLVERTCDSAADCGAGFVCESFGQTEPGVPGTCEVGPDGTEVCTDGGPVEPPPAESYCLPEGWQSWGAPSGGGSYGPDSPIASNQDGEVVGAESARPPRQDELEFAGADDGSTSGGCQVGSASGAAGSGLSLLALIAGVFGLRRRRD